LITHFLQICYVQRLKFLNVQKRITVFNSGLNTFCSFNSVSINTEGLVTTTVRYELSNGRGGNDEHLRELALELKIL
jgi:hypothetical protein